MVRKIYRDISVKSFRCATQHRKIIIFISHKYLCDCLHQSWRRGQTESNILILMTKYELKGQQFKIGYWVNQLSASKLFTISIIDPNSERSTWSGGKSGENHSILTQSAAVSTVLSIVWRCWVQWPVIIFSTQSYSLYLTFFYSWGCSKAKPFYTINNS